MSGQNVMQIAALEMCLITKLFIPPAVYNLCTALYTFVAASAINT